MHILIFSKFRESRDFISLSLRSQLDVEVSQASTLQGAMETLLDERSVDLLIYDQASADDTLIKFILSADAALPFIMVADSAQKQVKPYPELHVIGTVALSDLPGALVPLLRQHRNQGLQTQQAEFCQIAAELLVKVGRLEGDVYIRLSNVKFVKLFREGTEFSVAHLDQIRTSKKIQYLYLRNGDAPSFIRNLQAKLAGLKISDLSPEPQKAQSEITSIIETVHELVHRIGFTPEVQEVARENIRLVLDSIGSSPKLAETLAAVRPDKPNYISSHSMMLANISCCLAARMEWPSKSTFQKLAFAAFFHDITLQNQRLAAAASLKEVSSEFFSESDIQAYKEHPFKAAEMIKKMNEVPSEVDVIVAQHHERPNGRGFPAELSAQRIAPLSSVFIVAHEIVHAIMDQKGKFKLHEFSASKKEEYSQGNFKKVWQVLLT